MRLREPSVSVRLRDGRVAEHPLGQVLAGQVVAAVPWRPARSARVLLLIVLAIVAFNFFPVTAVMIAFLAVLNDGAILSIAYGHVRGSERPAAWDMRSVLVIAAALATIGVAETFLLFSVVSQVFGLSNAVIRTLIYLNLSLSGHLTIFVTRTCGPFWPEPATAPLLLGAVTGTQLIATLIAVYGMLMTPVGWGWAGVVWVYALNLVPGRGPGQARRLPLARSPSPPLTAGARQPS